jgi:hypothetical protein
MLRGWGVVFGIHPEVSFFSLVFLGCAKDLKPTGLVPSDDILLPGSKSRQKCLHLAVGTPCAMQSVFLTQDR